MEFWHFKIKKSVAGALALALLFAAGALGLSLANHGRIARTLSVNGLQLSGLSSEEASRVISEKAGAFQAKKIIFRFNEKTWTLTPGDLGITIEPAQTINNALSFGHDQNILASLGEQLQALFLKKDISLSYRIDREKWTKIMAEFSAIENPPANAGLKYDPAKNDFAVTPAKSGVVIDKPALIAGILSNFSNDKEISLSLIQANPVISENDAASVKEKAKSILDGAPYFIQTPNATWRLEKQELADWIQVIPSSGSQNASIGFDQKQVHDFLAPLISTIDRPAVNARLDWENGQLKFARLAQEGSKLNFDQSQIAIRDGLIAGQKNIALAIDPIQPEIDNKKIDELGIGTLIGRGESDFSGSTKNRIHNLTLGASKLNGLLIKPGETFSFGERIGEIDGLSGYLPELVIKKGQTLPEFGGGMCQVSTTLFRAAVYSGLKITERHNHAYAVHYYDPAGFDATVYPPSPDLKFVNDTPNNILLQNHVEGTKLIFEIYGTSDGRQVKVKGPTITSSKPDGSKKTVLSQQIWRQGKMEREDFFYSNYKSPDLYPVVRPDASPSPSPSATPSPNPNLSQ